MTCEPTILDCRIVGALLPDTRITFTDDDEVVTVASYSSWQVQAAPLGATVAQWTKTTGISIDGTEVVIAWADADLGTCWPGDWQLELSGTLAGRSRKALLRITIDPELT